MKKYLAVYTGSFGPMSEWNKLSESEKKEKEKLGMQAWGAWHEKNHSIIVDAGGPLGKSKTINKDGVKDQSNSLCGYVIVEATNQDEAAQLFMEHPHFTLFPGDGVEIMECMEIPKS